MEDTKRATHSPPITIGVGAPTRGRPLVYRRVLTDTSPESLSCALAHIACGLHSASAAVNTKLALQLVRAFAAYFRERAWPLLLMRGALAALSPCSWDLMPRHLCGRSILSDGASPPAAPSLFGWHRICVCAILAVAGDCFWATVHDGRRPRLPRLWRSRGRLGSATTASSTWRPGAVAPQPTLGAAVASRLVACFSFLSGPAGDKLCCHVALGYLYPRQHSGTCSARAAALAALRVSLVSFSLSAQASPRSPSWAAWRAGGCLYHRLE